jgi:hypothetical protein
MQNALRSPSMLILVCYKLLRNMHLALLAEEKKLKKRNAVAFILYQFKLAHWASLAVAYFGWAVTQ